GNRAAKVLYCRRALALPRYHRHRESPELAAFMPHNCCYEIAGDGLLNKQPAFSKDGTNLYHDFVKTCEFARRAVGYGYKFVAFDGLKFGVELDQRLVKFGSRRRLPEIFVVVNKTVTVGAFHCCVWI